MVRFWILVMVAVFGVYVALVVAMRLLRRVRKQAEKPIHADFTIAELHRMLQEGTIRPDEYERLKDVVLAHQVPLAGTLDPAAIEAMNRPASGKRGFDVLPPAPPPPHDPPPPPPADDAPPHRR